MSRSLIIAKITPGAEPEVARLFAESDRTELPQLAQVTHRALYSLGDLYVHVLETSAGSAHALAEVRQRPDFTRLCERLDAYIGPYLPTWRGPEDALANCFYSYRAPQPPH